MKKIISFLYLALFTLNINADISYDYFEFGYERLNVDSLKSANTDFKLNFDDIDGNGLVFEGSYSLSKNYFVYADFDFTSFDLDGDVVDFINDLGNTNNLPKVDRNTQVLGLGFHSDGNTQFVVKTGILRQKIDSTFLKEGTFGYHLELGGRGLFSDSLEWEANLNMYDPDLNKGAGGDLGANASLRYHFNERFSTDFATSVKDGQATFGLNFRFNFSH